MSSSPRWLQPVPSDKVGDAWWEVYPLLSEAVKSNNGRYTITDLRRNLLSQDMQLWIIRAGEALEAVAVTEIVNYPSRKVVRVNIGTGSNFREWIPLLSEIEEWGKENGCDGLESIARKGWAKVWGKQGYNQTHVFLEKDF